MLQKSPAPILVLPLWLPWSQNVASETVDTRPTYIICRESVMSILKLAGVAKVSNVYAKFFTNMWDTGRKKQKWKGRIAYASMTPPWLPGNVAFIHGKNHNATIPFTQQSLPSKNQIREKGNPYIGAAILDIFLRKEKETLPYLLFLLRNEGILFPECTERDSTNDIREDVVPSINIETNTSN